MDRSEKYNFEARTALTYNRNVPSSHPLFVQARVLYAKWKVLEKWSQERCSISHVDFIVFLRVIYPPAISPWKLSERNCGTSKCTLLFFDSAKLDYYLFNIAWKWELCFQSGAQACRLFLLEFIKGLSSCKIKSILKI